MIWGRWFCQKRVAVNGCVGKYEHISVDANRDVDRDVDRGRGVRDAARVCCSCFCSMMGDDPVFLVFSWYVYQLLCCKCKVTMRDRIMLQIMVIIMHRFLLMKDIIIILYCLD